MDLNRDESGLVRSGERHELCVGGLLESGLLDRRPLGRAPPLRIRQAQQRMYVRHVDAGVASPPLTCDGRQTCVPDCVQPSDC